MRWRQPLLALGVLVLGGAGAAWLWSARPVVEQEGLPVAPPLVRVIEARRQDLVLTIPSQGTVRPRTESTLVAEVAGRIVKVAGHFADGASFGAGEVLVEIDPADYRLAVAEAEAVVAQAELRLEREAAEAAVASEEWRALGDGEPSALVLRRPQMAEAAAALTASRAGLEKARLNLRRASVTAPYDGRVRRKRADVGQFVGAGTPLAEIYASDYAEVRLPVPQRELAFLDVDLGGRGGTAQPEVRLSSDLGGAPRVWAGRIVRTAGEIDPQTRMLDLVARIDDPFGRRAPSAAGAMPVGLFLRAEIAGKTAEDVIVLPRAALRGADQVLVVDASSRLRHRSVEVLRTERERVLLSGGVEEGELVCVSPLATVVDGMTVRTTREDTARSVPQPEGDRL